MRLVGHEARYGAFANVLYDFNVGLPYLYPYVGAGVGWQEDRFNNVSAAGADIDKSKGVLAYQGIAGLAMPISYVPGLSATLSTASSVWRARVSSMDRRGGIPASAKLTHEYNNQILVGLRHRCSHRSRTRR